MFTTIPDLPNTIAKYSSLEPKSVLEIGASNGMDAHYLQLTYNIDPKKVYCIEPNPNNFNTLSSSHPDFNNYHAAASNFTGKEVFQCHIPAADISSFKKRIDYYMYSGDYRNNYYDVEVEVYTMSDFFKINNIQSIDVCKIDVEGCTYEVLEGFGDRLSDVGAFHIEGELKTLYEDQKLFGDFKHLLLDANFNLVDYREFDDNTQCDSVWINNKYISQQ